MSSRLLLDILLLANIIVSANCLRFLHFSSGGIKPLNSNRQLPKPNRSVFDYEYRLPKTFAPTHYKLKLTFDAHKDEIKGRVMIDLKAREPTNYIVLHADPNYISDITGEVQIGPDTTEQLSPMEWNKTRQTIMAQWPRSSQNTTWRIDANFTTRPRLQEDMAYCGIYKVEGRLGSLLEMYGARKIMPSFDEPQLKATFEMEIELENFAPNFAVLSNSQGKRFGNVWRFAKTPRMSTYLLAFVVGDYTPVCMDRGPTEQCGTEMLPGQSDKVCHWLAPKYKHTQKDRAMELNKFGLTSYCSMQKYLHVQNQVELDFVLDDFVPPAALEDWGLIYVGKYAASEGTYAHEITHYWFGDLVSPSSWPHLWLNEAFARYFPTLSSLFINHDNDTIAKIAAGMQKEVVSAHSNYAVVDDVWANDYGKTEGIDTIPYTKGALILKMLHDVIGGKCFRMALRKYMEINKFGNAETNQLILSFQKSVILHGVRGWEEGEFLDVKTFMSPFLYKTGIPTIKISKSGGSKVLVEKTVPEGQKAEDWPLPLWAFETETKENKIYWILHETNTLYVPGKNLEWNKYHYTFASISVTGHKLPIEFR